MKSSSCGGHIVTISSISGLLSSPSAVTYSSTKASIISYCNGLTEQIRQDDLQEKIKTTCICLPTSMNIDQDYRSDKTTKRIVDAIIEEENFITIPKYFGVIIRVLSLLPLSVQQLARELFLRENS